MTINRTDAKDFAISRFAVDVDDWLDNALSEVCGGDPDKLQALYDGRAEDQLARDKATPEWAAATGEDDWQRYLAAGLPTLADLQPGERPLSAADVIAERERRLALGFEHDFGDARGIHHIGTTAADMAGWDEVTKLASALIASGTPTTGIAILTDTGPVSVTAAEWQHVLLESAAFRQPIWAASFALQAMDPIPADFANDDWWG